MRRRTFLASATLVATGFSLPDANAGSPDAVKARSTFHRLAAQILGMEKDKLTILPLEGTEELDSQSKLRTGALFAWTAEDEKRRVLLNGFTAADGAAAMEGLTENSGRPGGISALLEACAVLSAKPMALQDLTARVAFCLNNPATGEFLYDLELAKASGFDLPADLGPPVLLPQKTGKLLRYFTMTQGLTGTFDYSRVELTVLPGFRHIIHREHVR